MFTENADGQYHSRDNPPLKFTGIVPVADGRMAPLIETVKHQNHLSWSSKIYFTTWVAEIEVVPVAVDKIHVPIKPDGRHLFAANWR